MDETLVSDSLLPKYFKFTKSDQILRHLGVVKPSAKKYVIDPQNSKSDQIFSHKGLVRPCQNDASQSPVKKWTLRSFNYPK